MKTVQVNIEEDLLENVDRYVDRYIEKKEIRRSACVGQPSSLRSSVSKYPKPMQNTVRVISSIPKIMDEVHLLQTVDKTPLSDFMARLSHERMLEVRDAII